MSELQRQVSKQKACIREQQKSRDVQDNSHEAEVMLLHGAHSNNKDVEGAQLMMAHDFQCPLMITMKFQPFPTQQDYSSGGDTIFCSNSSSMKEGLSAHFTFFSFSYHLYFNYYCFVNTSLSVLSSVLFVFLLVQGEA